MCGRYALALSNEEIYDALENQLPRVFRRQRQRDRDRDQDQDRSRDQGSEASGSGSGSGGGRMRWERQQDYRGSYNIAPRSRAPVVRRDPEGSGEEAMLETMQWGLVPHWTKHPPSGPLNTINARSEGLLDASSGGMWHALKGHKRCIVPAQGYYEWQKKASAKVAHFTRRPLKPKLGEKADNLHPPLLFFAGLWDTVKYLSPVESRFKPSEPSGTTSEASDDLAEPAKEKAKEKREAYPTGNPLPLSTFTILTTVPAKDIAWLHDRMPCILSSEEDIARWLDLGEVRGWEEGKGGTGEVLTSTGGLDCFPVPPEVGKIGNNSPTFIQPVSERADGIKSFFQKQAPSPAKPKSNSNSNFKVKNEPATSPSSRKENKGEPLQLHSAKQEFKSEVRKEGEVKAEAEGIKSEVTEKDEEKGLGDDSNAPNPSGKLVQEQSSARSVKEEKAEVGEKRKRSAAKDSLGQQEEEEEEGEQEKPAPKRAGRQTKVVRRAEEEPTAQPAITTFFQSPQKSSSTPRGKKK